MNKLSTLSVAGALLLVAGGPAMAQGYPADPGYDQGDDYGPAQAPARIVPPGADYGGGAAYGSDPDQAYGGDPGYGGDPAYGGGPGYGGGADPAYPEDDYADGGPDRGPAPTDENFGLRAGRPYQPRYGEDVRPGHRDVKRHEQRRAEEDFGPDRNRNGEPRRYRRRPADEDMSDQ